MIGRSCFISWLWWWLHHPRLVSNLIKLYIKKSPFMYAYLQNKFTKKKSTVCNVYASLFCHSKETWLSQKHPTRQCGEWCAWWMAAMAASWWPFIPHHPSTHTDVEDADCLLCFPPPFAELCSPLLYIGTTCDTGQTGGKQGNLHTLLALLCPDLAFLGCMRIETKNRL